MALNPLQCGGSSEFLSLLQGGRKERRTPDLYQRLLAIHELAAAMSAARDLDHLLLCLARAYGQWIPAESVCLCLIDGNHYTRTHVSGFAVSPGEGSYPLHHGLIGMSIETGAPLLIADKLDTKTPVSALDEMAFEYLARSLMVLPLQAQDRVLGCLEFASGQPDQFTPLDYHLELLVAAHLSSALQNMLAKQQLAETNERLRAKEKELTELNLRLQELALTDDLTGLHNKRRLLMQLDFEIARARRYGGDLSCLMIDINGFKQVNDLHGHLAGDAVLCQMGSLLRRYCRSTDFVARYGGDEFMVILPHTNSLGALHAAEKLRVKAKEHIFEFQAELRLCLTISIGIFTCLDPAVLDAQGIIALADSALYDAKRAGGDRVCAANALGWPDKRVKNLSTG
jgi:diguanylate cyclase (GGDEF)-like protein